MRRFLTVLFSAASLMACQATEPIPCDTGEVQLISGYSGSPAYACSRTGASSFTLEIVPEAEPINPSPWYAFTLSGPEATRATITLDYRVHRHRYRPWMREDGGDWRLVPEADIAANGDASQVSLTVTLGGGNLHVAAQPLYGLAQYEALESQWRGDWRTAGRSVEGRAIRALILPPQNTSSTPQADPWIVLLGGQHPPEVPGAWAFEAFADAMVQRYHAGNLNAGLVLIPMLNPDGLHAGHWRLNAGFLDLNRDWATLSQPETRSVAALLQELLIDPDEIELMVDFHATVADRLYLPQPDELAPGASARLDSWLDAMAIEGLFELTEPRRTDPARRVSAKAVFTDEWRAVALTWEAGDNTPEATVRAVARQGALLWD